MSESIGSVSESNTASTSTVSGNLAIGPRLGMIVTGVAFAGQHGDNVGEQFAGIFGTLVVNADGTFNYLLDNMDTDTDLLSTGETATERFTITYTLSGVTQTLEVEIAITGLDEPGQVRIDSTEIIPVTEDTVLGREAQVRFEFGEGFYDQVFDSNERPNVLFENFGWIGLDATGGHPFPTAIVLPVGYTINRGRISINSSDSSAFDVNTIIGFGENHGVISASFNAPLVSEWPPGRAVGWQGITLNTGLIEAISNFDAYGVWAPGGARLVNTGVIYVEGGADYPAGSNRTDPLGIIGFRSGGTGGVDNSGTVHVVSNTPDVASVGFRFFLNSTNIYNPIYFDNSGTIVADRAIIASGGFQASTYLDNSGHVEGTLELQSGVNQIQIADSGTWVGNFLLGFEPDLVQNAGEIIGEINYGDGNDAYYGTDGSFVSGAVSGGNGNDLLQGGTGRETLSGGAGRDWIVGGGGADQLTGGADADTFVYYAATDSTASHRDTITDFQSGTDRIDISSLGGTGFSLSSASGGTILRSGSLEVFISGSVANSDVITGTNGAVIEGTVGSDILVATQLGSSLAGQAGDDALHGTSGNDVLDGGAGADTLFGGDGDDIFVMDNVGDLVVETVDGGTDELRTFVTTILPTYVEIGRLMGTDNIGIGGTAFDNILVGNSGNNVLRANGGNNTVFGGGGADLIYMNIGAHTAVYESILDSTADAPDRILFIDLDSDRIDLRAFEVQSFTVGEYRRVAETGGASLLFIDLTIVTVMTSDGELEFELGATPNLDLFLFDREPATSIQLFGLDENDVLNGGAGSDFIDGRAGNDTLFGGDSVDVLRGGLGNDTLDGGSNVDTAIVSGTQASYTVTQTSTGVFEVTGADGTDTLTNVEYLQLDDGTLRLLNGTGVSVNFETADTSVYQAAMDNIRDFDGNDVGGQGGWLRIGSADVNGDGDIDQILVNMSIGRFATVGTADDGFVYFDDHSWAGETRVAGIYIDPLVASGDVVAGSRNDSQTRFQNDLEIENINRVLGADDYDGDGLQEVYFALTDGTAYLHAYMHADGNIQYANYQSEQQVIDYLTANGFGADTYADWFPSGAEAGQEIEEGSQTKLKDLFLDPEPVHQGYEAELENTFITPFQEQLVEVFA